MIAEQLNLLDLLKATPEATLPQAAAMSVTLDEAVTVEEGKADAMSRLLSYLPHGVGDIFERIEQAERVIARRKVQAASADEASLIWSVFPALRPNFPGGVWHKRLYEAHYEELIDRAVSRFRNGAKKIDLRSPTDAEIAVLMAEASMPTPLTTDATRLYVEVMNRIFGEAAMQALGVGTSELPEMYEGRARELRGEIDRRFADRNGWRVLVPCPDEDSPRTWKLV